jgi:hypothetical protein
MLHKNLNDVLNRLGWVRDGDAWMAPKGQRSSVTLGRGHESVVVESVTKIEFGTETAVLTTARSERIGVEHDDIRAIWSGPER